MSSKRVSAVACGLILIAAAGCGRKRMAATDESAATEEKKPTSLLEKFPTLDPVPGSKSYPLRAITTESLLGRTKEGGPSSSWPFALVDARTRVEFEAEHIPGSINCPAEQVEQRLGALVGDKSKEVIFYCNGPDCTKSHKAGRSAIASGFSKAVVYDDGLPAWKKAGHPIVGDPLPKVELSKLEPAALAAAVKAKAVTVVDIRPRDEFLTFRIAGSINVELDELESKLKEQVKLATPICVADYTGKQQEMAARLLTKLGYTNVKVLEGGMRGWQQAKMPIDKGTDKPAAAKGEPATAKGEPIAADGKAAAKTASKL